MVTGTTNIRIGPTSRGIKLMRIHTRMKLVTILGYCCWALNALDKSKFLGNRLMSVKLKYGRWDGRKPAISRRELMKGF